MKETNAKAYKYIYLIKDKAYLLDANYNEHTEDITHGTNLFSLKWFFESYFGKEEYVVFLDELDKYDKEIKECLGYVLVKTLTPQAFINFANIIKREIKNFDYKSIVDIERIRTTDGKIFKLSNEEFTSINEQFLSRNVYTVLLGKSDFAESIITAEWLYDSMIRAFAVDLTMIGASYFKTIEQLLYQIICLKSDEINEEITLGEMAHYVKRNPKIFRKELSWNVKKYVIETIFYFSNLRNGYFHKHNIHKVEKISEIRRESFYMLFLLLGTVEISHEDLIEIGMSETTEKDDFYKLCSYINYQSGNLMIIQKSDSMEIIVVACSDPNINTVDGEFVYSGCYVKLLSPGNRVMKITKDNLSVKIYSAAIKSQDSDAPIQFVKQEKIFEEGHFLIKDDWNMNIEY